MLLQLASATRWLGPDGLRVFGASRLLYQMRPPQTALEFVVFADEHNRHSFFEFGEIPGGFGSFLYMNMMGAVIQAILPSFADANATFRFIEMELMGPERITIFTTDSVVTHSWRDVGSMRGLQWVGGVYRMCNFRFQVVTQNNDDFRRQEPYIAQVGQHRLHLSVYVEGVAIQFPRGGEDPDFIQNVSATLSSTPGYESPLVLEVITRPTVPAGPNRGLLLG